jgi:hypothetical protein
MKSIYITILFMDSIIIIQYNIYRYIYIYVDIYISICKNYILLNMDVYKLKVIEF